MCILVDFEYVKTNIACNKKSLKNKNIAEKQSNEKVQERNVIEEV